MKKKGVEFMQINVTRIGIRKSTYGGYSIQILDNISACNYARRSRVNWGDHHERCYYGYLKNVGFIIKWDKIIDRRDRPVPSRVRAEPVDRPRRIKRHLSTLVSIRNILNTMRH